MPCSVGKGSVHPQHFFFDDIESASKEIEPFLGDLRLVNVVSSCSGVLPQLFKRMEASSICYLVLQVDVKLFLDLEAVSVVGSDETVEAESVDDIVLLLKVIHDLLR